MINSFGNATALHNFDNLPDSANVRLPVVKALFACSDETIRRRVKAGLLPKPRKLGGRHAVYNVGDLRRALAESGRLEP